MSILQEAKALRRHEAVFMVIFFLATIAPGMLILQSFFPQLVKDLDVVKLLILSFGITLPVNVVNIAGCSELTRTVERDQMTADELLASMCLSFFVFYIPLLVNVFVSLSLKVFAATACGLEILIVVMMIAEVRKKRLLQKKTGP